MCVSKSRSRSLAVSAIGLSCVSKPVRTISSCAAYLDEITALQDAEFFFDRAKSEVASHTNPMRMRDQLKNPQKLKEHYVSLIASQCVCMSHNRIPN